jgi:hypothetical protein
LSADDIVQALGGLVPLPRAEQLTMAVAWENAHTLSYVDPAIWDFLLEFDIIPERVPQELARWVLPGAELPAAAVTPRGRAWSKSGCRLLVQMVDLLGRFCSVAAVRLDPGRPVAVLPLGLTDSSLLVACPLAQRLLAGDTAAVDYAARVGLVVVAHPLAAISWAASAFGDGEVAAVVAPAAGQSLAALAETLSHSLARRFGTGRVGISLVFQ